MLCRPPLSRRARNRSAGYRRSRGSGAPPGSSPLAPPPPSVADPKDAGRSRQAIRCAAARPRWRRAGRARRWCAHPWGGSAGPPWRAIIPLAGGVVVAYVGRVPCSRGRTAPFARSGLRCGWGRRFGTLHGRAGESRHGHSHLRCRVKTMGTPSSLSTPTTRRRTSPGRSSYTQRTDSRPVCWSVTGRKPHPPRTV